MSKYREKVKPTKEGLDELDESTRHVTIDRLIAGIKCKKTDRKKLLELTAHFRNRHSLEDSELDRLSEFAQDYNDLYATKNNKCFGTEEILLNKRQSQYKSWREMLIITSPRHKPSPRDAENPESIYEASFLTYRPYEKDIWGPASYGNLVYDLWNELGIIVDHMEDGKRLCKDVMDKEEEINKDPEWKEQLFWNQYHALEEKNHDTIEDHRKKGIANTDNPVYKKMLTYPSINHYAQNHFHDPSEGQFSDFVTTHSSLTLQGNDITGIESLLLGNDFEKIKLLRFAVDHAEDLLSVKGRKFDKMDTLILIKWCRVRKSIRRHKDNEHVLYNYITERHDNNQNRRDNTITFRVWTNIFDLRQQLGDDEITWKKTIEQLDKKIKELFKAYSDDGNEPDS